MINWEEYEKRPKRNQYKKDWYQKNKQDRKVKDYRAAGLNFIKNHSEIKDLREFRKAVQDRKEVLTDEQRG